MDLSDLTSPELIFPGLVASDAATILSSLAEKIVANSQLPDPQALFAKLWEREQLGSTGIGSGVGVPHCKIRGLPEVLLAIGIAPAGVDFGAVDQQPVNLFFLIISPEESPTDHLKCLAAISKWAQADGHIEGILKLRQPSEIYRYLSREPATEGLPAEPRAEGKPDG